MSANKFNLELQTEVLEAKASVKPLPETSGSNDSFHHFYEQANRLAKETKPFSKEEIEEVAQFLKKNASSTDSTEEFARFKARWLAALEKVYGQSSAEFEVAKKELMIETKAQTSALASTISPSASVSDTFRPTGKLLELKFERGLTNKIGFISVPEGRNLNMYNRDAEMKLAVARGTTLTMTGMVGKMMIGGVLRDVTEVEVGENKYFVAADLLSHKQPAREEKAATKQKETPKKNSPTPSSTPSASPTEKPEAAPKKNPSVASDAKAGVAANLAEQKGIDLTRAPHITLTNGEKVFGMIVKDGQRYFIGSKEKRIPFDVRLLPEELRLQEIQSEGVKKVEPLIDDSYTFLTAFANHAAAEDWKSKEAFGARVGAFLQFIQTLDYSDEKTARAAIIDFVMNSVVAGGDLQKEFQEVFLKEDTDEVRRKKIYDYIRGSIGLRAKSSWFTGGSDYLAQKLSAQELLKRKITPQVLEKMADQFLDTDWRTKDDKAVTKEIIAKKSELPWSFIVESYGEKNIVDFVEKFRKLNKDLEKAYNSEQMNKQFDALKVDGKTPTASEISQFKVNSKKAKLMTLMGQEVIENYAENHKDERKTNTTLDTFADIRGIGWNTLSDSTVKYLRNDLWLDATIELAALGAGALSLGAGTAAIQAAQAARWGIRATRALEAASAANKIGKVGISAGRFVTTAAVNGVAFELGNGGIRSLAASARNGEWTSAYSLEGFVQSTVFMGAFGAIEKSMAKAGIKIAEWPLLQQKKVLATLMTADTLASMGLSFGISSYQGEDWTLEEALQAAAMAVVFRGVSSHMIARRTPRGPVVTMGPNDGPQRPAVTIRGTKEAIGRARAGDILEIVGESKYQKTQTGKWQKMNADGTLSAEIVSAREMAARIRGKESTITTPPTAAPAGAPTVAASLSEARALNPFFKQLKNPGDSVEIGALKITKKVDGWEIKKGNEPSTLFTEKSRAMEYVRTNVGAHDILASRMKDLTQSIKNRFKKPRTISIGDEAYRIEEAGGVLKIGKKEANGGFLELSADDIARLPEAKIVKIFDEINPGLGSRMSKMMLDPLENLAPSLKLKKVKDVFSPKVLKGIPKFLWNQSVGEFVASMKNTWIRPLGGVWDLAKRVPQSFAQVVLGSRVGPDGKINFWKFKFNVEESKVQDTYLGSKASEWNTQGAFLNAKLLGAAAIFTGVDMLVSDENDDVVNEYFSNIASLNILGWLGAAVMETTPYSEVPAKMTRKVASMGSDKIDSAYRTITGQSEKK